MYKPAYLGAATTTPPCGILSFHSTKISICSADPFFINLQYTIWHAAALILYFHNSL